MVQTTMSGTQLDRVPFSNRACLEYVKFTVLAPTPAGSRGITLAVWDISHPLTNSLSVLGEVAILTPVQVSRRPGGRAEQPGTTVVSGLL